MTSKQAETSTRTQIFSVLRDTLVELGVDTSTPVTKTTPLHSYGVDSLFAMELSSTLSDRLSVHIPNTIVFDYPTVGLLVDALLRFVDGTKKSINEVNTSGIDIKDSQDDQISIIDCFDEHNHRTRIDSVFRLEGRWVVDPFESIDSPHSHSTRPSFGGLLTNVHVFDFLLFGMRFAEAIEADPQHRLLLKANFILLQSGHGGTEQTQASVLVGITTSEYATLTIGSQCNNVCVTNVSNVSAGRLIWQMLKRFHQS